MKIIRFYIIIFKNIIKYKYVYLILPFHMFYIFFHNNVDPEIVFFLNGSFLQNRIFRARKT